MAASYGLSLEDHVLLAYWAADCAEHVLPYFEAAFPGDRRPREAIATCRAWGATRDFRMTAIRSSSLAAHAAARAAQPESAAHYAARAAGQAAATPHVPAHALGPAWYGAKLADVAHLEAERTWQWERLPPRLRGFVLAVAEYKPALGKVLRYPGMV